MRVPRFSPRSGMTRLETVRVSQASADQRRGRAGRLEPGVCFRLWPEEQQRGLLAFTPPEISMPISRRWPWSWRCGAPTTPPCPG